MCLSPIGQVRVVGLTLELGGGGNIQRPVSLQGRMGRAGWVAMLGGLTTAAAQGSPAPCCSRKWFSCLLP